MVVCYTPEYRWQCFIIVTELLAVVSTAGPSKYANLAILKITKQSGYKDDIKAGYSIRAVDGATSSFPEDERDTCTYTDYVKNPYWRVYFRPDNHKLPIKYVMISNAKFGGLYLNNFEVTVIPHHGSDIRKLCYRFYGQFPVGGTRLLKCDSHNLIGVGVEIKVLKRERTYLALCEVAVFQTHPGYYNVSTLEVKSNVDVDVFGHRCLRRQENYCIVVTIGHRGQKLPACVTGKTISPCTIPPYYDDFEYKVAWTEWTTAGFCGKVVYSRVKLCKNNTYHGKICPRNPTVKDTEWKYGHLPPCTVTPSNVKTIRVP